MPLGQQRLLECEFCASFHIYAIGAKIGIACVPPIPRQKLSFAAYTRVANIHMLAQGLAHASFDHTSKIRVAHHKNIPVSLGACCLQTFVLGSVPFVLDTHYSGRWHRCNIPRRYNGTRQVIEQRSFNFTGTKQKC